MGIAVKITLVASFEQVIGGFDYHLIGVKLSKMYATPQCARSGVQFGSSRSEIFNWFLEWSFCAIQLDYTVFVLKKMQEFLVHLLTFLIVHNFILHIIIKGVDEI
jgi:hypothetical protein